MKNYFSILLLLLPLLTLADDWDLFQPYQETYYTVVRGGDTLISRYEVDSVYVDGNETHYLLNYNYLKDFQNLNDYENWSNLLASSLNIDLGDISQMHSFVKNSQTQEQKFKRISTTGYENLVEISFNGNAAVGDNIGSNLSCISSGTAEFLGVTDSIKIFLFNTYPIVLSKNYGLLKGPYLSDFISNNDAKQILSIAGFSSNGVFYGSKTPRVESFIPYQVGDTIRYLTSSQMVVSGNGSPDYPSYNNIERIIESRTETDSTIIIGTRIYDKKYIQHKLDYNIHTATNGVDNRFQTISFGSLLENKILYVRFHYNYSKNKYQLYYEGYQTDAWESEYLDFSYLGGIGFIDYNNHALGDIWQYFEGTDLTKYPSYYDQNYDEPPPFVDIQFDLNPSFSIETETIDTIHACLNDNIQFFELGNTALTWNWQGPNSFISSNQNPTKNVNFNDQGWYFVSIVNTIGEIAIDSTYLHIDYVHNDADNFLEYCESSNFTLSGNSTLNPHVYSIK